MPKLVVFAVFDKAVQVYGRPFPARNEAEATRMFVDEAGRDAPDNPWFKHPGDFALCRIGTYDEETGELEAQVPTPAIVFDGLNLVKEATPSSSRGKHTQIRIPKEA